jgi:hypothetical protein
MSRLASALARPPIQACAPASRGWSCRSAAGRLAAQRREQPQPEARHDKRAHAAQHHRAHRPQPGRGGAGLEFAQLVGSADEQRVDCADAAAHGVGCFQLHQCLADDHADHVGCAAQQRRPSKPQRGRQPKASVARPYTATDPAASARCGGARASASAPATSAAHPPPVKRAAGPGPRRRRAGCPWQTSAAARSHRPAARQTGPAKRAQHHLVPQHEVHAGQQLCIVMGCAGGGACGSGCPDTSSRGQANRPAHTP